MDTFSFAASVGADPAGAALSGLRILHFVGLALGLGAATLLDLMILRFFLRERVTGEGLRIFAFAADRVGDGLLLLWLSGIGLLVWLSAFDPARLGNEKIWAKIAIVAILTINGAFIHAVVLPRLQAQVGSTLLAGMSPAQRRVFVGAAAVSLVSWCAPLALACLPQLNFTTPIGSILWIYAVALAIAVGFAWMVVAAIAPPEPGGRQLADARRRALGARRLAPRQ